MDLQKQAGNNKLKQVRMAAEKPKRVKKFTLKNTQGVSKQVDDLTWQIKFAQMKLNHWHALENEQWRHLEALKKHAYKDLRDLPKAAA